MSRPDFRFTLFVIGGVMWLASNGVARAQSAPPVIDEKTPSGLVTRSVPPALPIIPDQNQRSGLVTRSVPIVSHLPMDKDRDQFYDTRWNDKWVTSPTPRWPNNPLTSGLYGLRLPNDCTSCYSPYFQGSPGKSTNGPNCGRMKFRLINGFVHPFQPICHYYAGGCYVPVYNLDPTVPGVNAFPFGGFWRRTTGG